MPIANVNGININYKVEGQGEPLIMISGFPSTNWRPQKKHSRNITAQSPSIIEALGSLTNQLGLTL
jgi:pimeloyl-ACP methyl ester carboxylesterase